MKKAVAVVNLSNHHCMNHGWCRFVCDILTDPSNVMHVIICCTTHFGNVGVQFQVWVQPNPAILCSTYWDDPGIIDGQFTNIHFTKLMTRSVLSIGFEVDVPTGKVGGSLLFERQRRELPRGVWRHALRKFWNLDAWKCCFQPFPDSIWALRSIKIKTLWTIF